VLAKESLRERATRSRHTPAWGVDYRDSGLAVFGERRRSMKDERVRKAERDEE
jgi:hypothetical protein